MGLDISKLHVRRSILIQASPSRVWKEFESFDRLTVWFGRGHNLLAYEPKVGGQIELSVDRGSGLRTYGGEVLILENEREISFSINWHDPSYAWPVPTLWTLRLTPLYDETLVEIFHHGFERFGLAAADELEGYEDGWDLTHLKALREIVEA